MSSRQMVTLTIPAGATRVSNVLPVRNVRELSIQAPAALTGTVTLQSGVDEAGTSLANVQSPPGTDVTLAAGKTTVLTAAPFPSIALASNADEAAPRVFTVCVVVGE